MIYTCFDKKDYETVSNQELADELQKPIIRKFDKQKVHSSFTDNVWGADLIDMQLISNSKIMEFAFYCVLLIFSVNAHELFRWKTKKVLQLLRIFKKISDESNRKPNKIYVDKGSEFYNRSIKSWFQDNDLEMCSTYNDGKSVVADRFIRRIK